MNRYAGSEDEDSSLSESDSDSEASTESSEDEDSNGESDDKKSNCKNWKKAQEKQKVKRLSGKVKKESSVKKETKGEDGKIDELVEKMMELNMSDPQYLAMRVKLV